MLRVVHYCYRFLCTVVTISCARLLPISVHSLYHFLCTRGFCLQVCVSGPEHLVGKTLVEVSPDFYRPTDVVNLWGDPTKAKAELGWDPGKTSFEELVRIMVEADMAKVAVERAGDHVRTNLAEYLEKGIVK